MSSAATTATIDVHCYKYHKLMPLVCCDSRYYAGILLSSLLHMLNVSHIVVYVSHVNMLTGTMLG